MNKKDTQKKSADAAFIENHSVTSSTECTGLIQRPPETEDEAEAYTEIYSIPQSTDARDKMTGPDGRR